MTEADWLACSNFTEMLKFAGKGQQRRLRLLLCADYEERETWDMRSRMPGGEMEICRKALAVAEDFADGSATEEQIAAARASLELLHEWPYRYKEEYGAYAVNHLHHALEHNIDLESVNYYLMIYTDLTRRYDDELSFDLLLDVFGNPFHVLHLDPQLRRWRDGTIVQLAQSIYAEKAFDRLPILADALEEAGCDIPELLAHCRNEFQVPKGVCRNKHRHFKGCWALDRVIGTWPLAGEGEHGR